MVRQRLYDEGIPVIDWARSHGFDVHLVYSVLSGRSRASRGEGHRIAVALGLKPGAPQLSQAKVTALAPQPATDGKPDGTVTSYGKGHVMSP